MPMPRRPRSHQLEDESVTEFKRLLPSQWVVLTKDHDYGVDLEVEIFNANEATGLTFNVQLKATDDPDKADKLSLSSDKLEYYHALTVPTLIVRYSSQDGRFFHQWHMNLLDLTGLAEDQKSFTYTFAESDCWMSETPAAIERTLRVMRALEGAKAGTRVALRMIPERLDVNEQFRAEGAIHDVIEGASDALTTANAAAPIEISIVISPEACSVSVDCLSSLTFQLDGIDRKELATLILYAVVALLARHRLSHQADRVAQALPVRDQPIHSSFVAYEACRAIANNLNRAVDLAVLNGLHGQENEFYGPFLLLLLRHPQDESIRDEAIARFYSLARLKARDRGDQAEAAVCYSLGNYLRNRGKLPAAAKAYNDARKLRSEYCVSSYFLTELGACFFGAAHYAASARAYRMRHDLGDVGPIDRLYLADALLFSGRPGDAEGLYEALVDETGEPLFIHEAGLKLGLCQWLQELVGAEKVPTARTKASEAAIGNLSMVELKRLVVQTDSLNELAHFNLGVGYAKLKQYDEAFPHFLICAFKQSGDDEAWASSIICATNMKEPTYMLATMACAISLRGGSAYERLRDQLFEQGAHANLLGAFDEMAREFGAMVDELSNSDLTVRALRDHQYDLTRDPRAAGEEDEPK